MARRLFGRIVMRMTYGYPVTGTNDPYIRLAEDALKSLVIGVMGNHPVDTYPLLRYLPAWLPGMGFKKSAKEFRNVIDAFMNKPFEFVKHQMVNFPSNITREQPTY